MKAGDFVYSKKYSQFGLVVNDNGNLMIFRKKKVVNSVDIFGLCNFRDEELYLKFDLKSYEWYRKLLLAYFHYTRSTGETSTTNGVFSFNKNNTILNDYTEPKFIYNMLLKNKPIDINNIKPGHIYLCIETKYKDMDLFYYYGKGTTVSSYLCNSFTLEEARKYYLSLEYPNNNQIRKCVENFIKVNESISGHWFSYGNFNNLLTNIQWNKTLSIKYTSGHCADTLDGLKKIMCTYHIYDDPSTLEYKLYDFGTFLVNDIEELSLQDFYGYIKDRYKYSESRHYNVQVKFKK